MYNNRPNNNTILLNQPSESTVATSSSGQASVQHNMQHPTSHLLASFPSSSQPSASTSTPPPNTTPHYSQPNPSPKNAINEAAPTSNQQSTTSKKTVPPNNSLTSNEESARNKETESIVYQPNQPLPETTNEEQQQVTQPKIYKSFLYVPGLTERLTKTIANDYPHIKIAVRQHHTVRNLHTNVKDAKPKIR